jgi:hypothetical protein
MLPDRGGIDQRERSLSTSAPTQQRQETEPCQEAEVPIKEPAQHDEPMETSQVSPRSAARPSAAPLSRNPSSSSGTSTPVPESRSSPPRPVEPPVTKGTLSELDVSKIIHNPKLRHDINFDPELHFRPNLDGEKGRKKQDKANQFWNTLKAELIEFVIDRQSFISKHPQGDDWCLPSLLKAVKEIIQTLVPQRDRQFLDEGLNVELLMQQFDKGVADLEKLALWLSSVLKSHCAPMRDEWVDTMYNQLSTGNQQNDMDLLVVGMRSLLSVLEAMKLDVANHQIRCLRPVLIEDTAHFEQRFFEKKILSRKLDVTPATQWYREALERYSVGTGINPHAFGDMSVFFEALSRLIVPSGADKRVPSTFLFDEERIVKLRADALDAVNLEVCMRMYEDAERFSRFSASLLKVNAPEESGSRRSMDFNFNAPTSASSRPSSLVFSSAGSNASSPRSSLVIPSYVAPDHSESRNKSQKLYSSLVALMQSAPSLPRQSARWEAMASSMALQIFRYTNMPSDMLPQFEKNLAANLKPDSRMHQDVEHNFRERLMSELATRVCEFKALSGVALFSAATGTRTQTSRDRDTVRDGQDDGGLEDMATRLAHLGILHWRVWAQLAYAIDGDEEMSDDAFDI